MPTTTLSAGPSHSILQNVVYAIPPGICYIYSDTALQISNDSAFGASQAVSANTPTLATGRFVRCAVSGAVVRLAHD